jgi:hypothetical protein
MKNSNPKKGFSERAHRAATILMPLVAFPYQPSEPVIINFPTSVVQKAIKYYRNG